MLFRHVLPGILSDSLPGSCSDKQQTECERLGEGCGEQLVKIARGIAACFRMGVENVAKFLPHLQEGVPRVGIGAQFCQPIANDAANKTSGVRHQRSKVLGIAGDRLLTRPGGKHFNKPHERRDVVTGDGPVCAGSS